MEAREEPEPRLEPRPSDHSQLACAIVARVGNILLVMQRAFVDGRYVVERLLGGGGMAQVYLTHDGVLDRHVALKVLRDQYADDEEFIQRFRHEARSVASLSHPNIVSIYDQGRSEDGAHYIAMRSEERRVGKECRS